LLNREKKRTDAVSTEAEKKEPAEARSQVKNTLVQYSGAFHFPGKKGERWHAFVELRQKWRGDGIVGGGGKKQATPVFIVKEREGVVDHHVLVPRCGGREKKKKKKKKKKKIKPIKRFRAMKGKKRA